MEREIRKTWSYRVIRYAGDEGYGLHEVHFENDIPVSRTNRASVVGDSPKSIIEQLLTMRICAKNRPVLDDNFWEIQANAHKG